MGPNYVIKPITRITRKSYRENRWTSGYGWERDWESSRLNLSMLIYTTSGVFVRKKKIYEKM